MYSDEYHDDKNKSINESILGLHKRINLVFEILDRHPGTGEILGSMTRPGVDAVPSLLKRVSELEYLAHGHEEKRGYDDDVEVIPHTHRCDTTQGQKDAEFRLITLQQEFKERVERIKDLDRRLAEAQSSVKFWNERAAKAELILKKRKSQQVELDQTRDLVLELKTEVELLRGKPGEFREYLSVEESKKLKEQVLSLQNQLFDKNQEYFDLDQRVKQIIHLHNTANSGWIKEKEESQKLRDRIEELNNNVLSAHKLIKAISLDSSSFMLGENE